MFEEYITIHKEKYLKNNIEQIPKLSFQDLPSSWGLST